MCLVAIKGNKIIGDFFVDFKPIISYYENRLFKIIGPNGRPISRLFDYNSNDEDEYFDSEENHYFKLFYPLDDPPKRRSKNRIPYEANKEGPTETRPFKI